MKVIGITGKAGAGKDSVARIIQNRAIDLDASGTMIVRFSDGLKQQCCRMFGWDPKRINDLDYKEEWDGKANDGKTRREVLQHFGTEGVRALYSDYWAEEACDKIECYAVQGDVVIVPDLRFLNEARILRQRFADCILLRVSLTGVGAGQTDHDGHPSETEQEQIEVDWEIQAEKGDMDELRKRTIAALAQFRVFG